ncbi:MAG: hypothetical protein ACP5HX_05370 [Thermoproteota archaeon]
MLEVNKIEQKCLKKLFFVLVLYSINAIIVSYETFSVIIGSVHFLKVRETFSVLPLPLQSLFFFFILSVFAIVNLISPFLVYFGIIKNIKTKNWTHVIMWANFIGRLLLVINLFVLLAPLTMVVACLTGFATMSIDMVLSIVILLLQWLTTVTSSIMLLSLSKEVSRSLNFLS